MCRYPNASSNGAAGDGDDDDGVEAAEEEEGGSTCSSSRVLDHISERLQNVSGGALFLHPIRYLSVASF